MHSTRRILAHDGPFPLHSPLLFLVLRSAKVVSELRPEERHQVTEVSSIFVQIIACQACQACQFHSLPIYIEPMCDIGTEPLHVVLCRGGRAHAAAVASAVLRYAAMQIRPGTPASTHRWVQDTGRTVELHSRLFGRGLFSAIAMATAVHTAAPCTVQSSALQE